MSGACGEHHSKTIKTTQNSAGIRKKGSVGMEQMRRMDEMVCGRDGEVGRERKNIWTLPERY